MSASKQPTAIVVADSHFHLNPNQAEQERVERFCDLLDFSTRADHLVLLGDIFDFWFDYPHFRLKGFDGILNALDRVRDSGTRIHFIGGNHDIWAADFMSRRYGCRPGGETTILELGDRRLLLTHGDGLLKFDWAYNSFRAVVRTRAGIVLAKALHPEILYAFSSWLSGRSRSATRDEAAKIEVRGRRWLERQGEPDWDIIVMGHVHHAFTLSSGPRQMVSLAGWFDVLSYGLLQDGTFRLLDFAKDPLPNL